MMLTGAQHDTLTAYITATLPNASTLATTTNGIHTILAHVNSPTTFIVWRSFTPATDIVNAINWPNLTPANPIAGSGQDAGNWLLACQGKQFNLQILLSLGTGIGAGQGIDSTKANIRAGFQDALTNIPSGVNGALKSGGWPAVNAAMQRVATHGEVAFATGSGTTSSPGLLGYEGIIQDSDIYMAIFNDDGTIKV